MIRQTLTLLVAVMGMVLIVVSLCLEQASAAERPAEALRARVTLPSPLQAGDLQLALEALLTEFPDHFAPTVRLASTGRALPAVVSRNGDALLLTFEATPATPLTDFTGLRVQAWDSQGLVATVPASLAFELEGLRVVTSREVPKGRPLTTDDLALAWVSLRGRAGQAAVTTPDTLLGRVPVRACAVGQVLEPRQLEEPILISRGATVRVLVLRGGLTLETQAIALQSGSRGALIKFKNPDTGASLIARVTGLNQAEVD